MKTTLSEQQTAFFTKNGFIEFEIPYPPLSFINERDQWRKNEKLKQFILKKLGPIALLLTGKKKLRLGLDQGILNENRPEKCTPLKEMFSVQGIEIGIAIAQNPILPLKKPSLGILPFPSHSERILFFKPDLILNWPELKSDLFLILFALPNAVYIQNAKDPFTHFLKQFGYHFGDCLNNQTHPLVFKDLVYGK